MEELQKLLHDFRREIDSVTNKVKTLKDLPQAMVCAREIALSVTKLQEGKMWLGKALEESGSPFPENLADKANQGTTGQAAQAQPQPTPSAMPATPAQPEAPANPQVEAAANGEQPAQ